MKKYLIILLMYMSVNIYAQNAGSPFTGNAENPGIFVAGDLIGSFNWTGNLGYFGVQGLELGISAPLDPFARVDVTLHHVGFEITGHDHTHEDTNAVDEHEHGSGFALEEALITLTSLPAGLQFSAGRMRSVIGLANVVHLHDFNFTLYPNIITSYWGEEGLSVDGGRLSWLTPLPIWIELVVEGQSKLNLEGTDFLTAGLNLFLSPGDDSGLKLSGFTYFNQQSESHPLYSLFHEEDLTNTAIATLFHNQEFGLNGWGAGLRYKWKKDNVSLLAQGEWQSRKLGQLFYNGYYGFIEAGLKSLSLGVQYQDVQVPHYHDTEGEIEAESHQDLTIALSWFLSEFHRARLSYILPLGEVEAGHEKEHMSYLQWTFMLGPHKPHAY